ncbi:dihydrofolate reductase family protein [Candidatus Dojkabacteria bacterium]|uniref:Dihydrofolate reductase family protein n=2 Tax=Candidatus Dojkabacteria TaxID=74243 RepID=A0A952DUW1_9BACT|nr:dihydrofolate reductase family protein [Candidatus Dojkabacteria bacterium]
MHITLLMAQSANGLICDKNGKEDFLSKENWQIFVDKAKEIGCLIWGRTTYEAVSSWGSGYLKQLIGVRKIILSRSKKLFLPMGFEQAMSVSEAVYNLESAGIDKALVSGGSQTNSAFTQAGLVDELILLVNPVLIGEGKGIFSGLDFEIGLKLEKITTEKNEIIKMVYKVLN